MRWHCMGVVSEACAENGHAYQDFVSVVFLLFPITVTRTPYLSVAETLSSDVESAR